MATAPSGNGGAYFMFAPDGRRIEITRELFAALEEFVVIDRTSCGSITVHFKQGGIAGIKALKETVYK